MAAERTTRCHGIEIKVYQKSILVGGDTFFLKRPVADSDVDAIKAIMRRAFNAGFNRHKLNVQTATKNFFNAVGITPSL